MYLPAEKADSVSIYITCPSKPPILFGRVVNMLKRKENWVFPTPGGPESLKVRK